MSRIEGLEMRMYSNGTLVQSIEDDRKYVLDQIDLIGAVGVYDSEVHLTEWRADMVIKISVPKFGLEWVEVYANHRDFAVVWKKKNES